MIELKNYQRTAVHELKERVKPYVSLDTIYQSSKIALPKKRVRQGIDE